MISCQRVIAINVTSKQLRTSYTQWICKYSSGKEIEPVKVKTSLEQEHEKKSDLKLRELEEHLPMEPERDNRLMVKRKWSDINNFLPNNWIAYVKTKKDNYFFPPNSVVFAKDGVSRARYTICFRAEYTRLYVGWTSLLTPFIVTTLIGSGIWASLRDRSADPNYDPYDFNQGSFVTVGVIMAGLYYLLAFQYVVRMKAIRMYYSKDKQEFIIVWFNPWNPYWIRKMRCRPGEAKVVRGFFHNTEINGKKFSIAADDFSFAAYFNVLYGYSKPKDIEKLLDGNETAEQFFRNRKKGERSRIYDIR